MGLMKKLRNALFKQKPTNDITIPQPLDPRIAENMLNSFANEDNTLILRKDTKFATFDDLLAKSPGQQVDKSYDPWQKKNENITDMPRLVSQETTETSLNNDKTHYHNIKNNKLTRNRKKSPTTIKFSPGELETVMTSFGKIKTRQSIRKQIEINEHKLTNNKRLSMMDVILDQRRMNKEQNESTSEMSYEKSSKCIVLNE